MSQRSSPCELIHIAFLSVCVGALVMVGGTAAAAFPTAHHLDPRLPGLEGYTGEHWILTAGGIMAPAFHFAGWVQYICIVGAVIAFAFARRHRAGSRLTKLTIARSVILLALVLISGYQAVSLQPRMDRNLDSLWKHARAGDNAAALSAKTAFDSDHGIARTLLESCLLLSLVGVILAGLSATKLSPTESRA